MNSQGNVIKIVEGCNTFTLTDSFSTRIHSGDFSTFPVGGLIVGFSKTGSGCSGVVNHESGSLFVMNGGTIMNCSNTNGGGVLIGGGACFVMNNGTITECHAINEGGGVNVTGDGSDSVYFTMNGGTIENCSSGYNYEGVAFDCVSLGLGAKFHANGGTVKGNIRLVNVTVDSEKQNSCTTCYGTVLISRTAKLKAGVFYGGALEYFVYADETDFTIESLITSPYYTVSFDLDGGTGDIPKQYFVNTTSAKALKPTDPTKDGYAFLGWYNGNAEYKFDKPVTANVSLKAKWESINVNSESELKNKINLGLDTVKLTSDIKLTSTLDLGDKTLTIDLNGQVLTGDIKIADSSSSNKSEITLIDSNPTATHSNTSLPLGGVLNGNITLTRNGGSKSVLNANGGSVTGTLNLHSYASKVYNSNNNRTTTSFYGNVNVAVSNAEIYTGIYYKALSQNFKSSVKGKLLTFYVDGNEYCYEVYTASNENSRVPIIVAPAQPTKSGYAFASWKYKPASSEESFDWSFGLGEADIFPTQLNAAFSSNTYSISYELNDGTATNPTTYTVESEDITLTNPTKSGYTFTGWSGTGLTGENNMTVIIPKGSTGNRSYTAHWKDVTAPVITGIENDKTYCGEVKFKVTDNVGVTSVVFGERTLTADAEGYYTIEAGAGYGLVVATDAANNMAYCSINVRRNHIYNWHDDGTYYWQECDNCHLTTPKKQIPSISIDIKGADKACRMSEYVFSFEIPDGCKNPGGYIEMNGTSGTKDPVCTVEGNVATITILADSYGDADSFNAVAVVQLEDGYIIEVSKTVSILNEHTGGTADCTHKAKCEVCGEEYGEVDGTIHTDEKEWSTKNATQHEQTWKCCGAVEVALENHEWKNGICEECGYVCVHTGGEATCANKAICEICGEEYGEINAENHTGGTQLQNVSEATCTEPGYTGDTCCLGCGATLIDGQIIPATGHLDANKDHICDVVGCGASVGEHQAADGKHTCDYCDQTVTECEDENDDHLCDVCGATLTAHAGGTATCTDKAICEICGKEYGEFDPDDHSDLIHVPEQAATTESEGNIEYWYCADCDRYFSDENCTEEITLADTVTAKQEPPATEPPATEPPATEPPKTDVPKTGDVADVAMLLALILISSGALIATVAGGKKKRYSAE